MITLTITTKSGTTISLNIPEDGTNVTIGSKTPESTPSAVVYHNEPQAGAEGAKSSDCAAVDVSSHDWPKYVKLTNEVPEFVKSESQNEPRDTGMMRDGGGVGEEDKEESVRGGKGGGLGEGKGEETSDFSSFEQTSNVVQKVEIADATIENLENVAWPTRSGDEYFIPSRLKKLWRTIYRDSFILLEARKAYIWLSTNPAKGKTMKGVGKFLAGWLSRAKQNEPTTTKSDKGFLNECNNDATSW